jgi:hypothetical protein
MPLQESTIAIHLAAQNFILPQEAQRREDVVARLSLGCNKISRQGTLPSKRNYPTIVTGHESLKYLSTTKTPSK